MRGLAHRVLAALAASLFVAAAGSADALAAEKAPVQRPPGGGHHSAGGSATLSSPALWATVDVCNKGSKRVAPVIGIRGSMPADGHLHDWMYMRFGVEYLDSDTGKWSYLPHGAESTYTKVGRATATRQAGRDFHLARPVDGARFQLRGVVEFEWRRAGKVVLSATRETSGGHHSAVLHAEPPGFSAASCTIE